MKITSFTLSTKKSDEMVKCCDEFSYPAVAVSMHLMQEDRVKNISAAVNKKIAALNSPAIKSQSLFKIKSLEFVTPEKHAV